MATKVDAGHADNALPQRARATVNCRILPGEPIDGVQATLQRVLADGKSFQLLSDDGDEKTGGVPCKEAPPEKRKFRSVTVSL